MTSKNQLTLPRAVTQAIGPVEYFDVEAKDGQIVLTPVRILPSTRVIVIPDPPPRVPPCRDAFDVPFLQLATAGRASVLVSGDADLLALAGQTRFAILPPAEFASALSGV
jgi:predicted nucleic acid-binding protein